MRMITIDLRLLESRWRRRFTRRGSQAICRRRTASQRCHNCNNTTSNDTGNCQPPVPSETACTQNAIGARDLPRGVRL